MVMLNTNANTGAQMWEDGLRLFFNELLGKDLPKDEQTAELYAHVIAAMYGPTLKELENR